MVIYFFGVATCFFIFRFASFWLKRTEERLTQPRGQATASPSITFMTLVEKSRLSPTEQTSLRHLWSQQSSILGNNGFWQLWRFCVLFCCYVTLPPSLLLPAAAAAAASSSCRSSEQSPAPVAATWLLCLRHNNNNGPRWSWRQRHVQLVVTPDWKIARLGLWQSSELWKRVRRVIWEEQGRLGLPLSKVGTLKLMTSENEITDEVTIHHQA